MSWNPSGPSQAGFEWPVWRQVGSRLNRSDQVAGALVKSTSAETISSVQLWLGGVLGGSLKVEVFEDADLPVTVDTFVYRPTAGTVSGSDNVVDQDGNSGTTPWADAVNEVQRDLSTYLRPEVNTSNMSVALYVGSGAHDAPNAIRAVRVVGWCEYVGEDDIGDVTFSIWTNGTSSNRAVATLEEGTGPVLLSEEWTENPQTGEPWTQADIREFESGGATARRIGVMAAAGDFRLYQVWMEVDNLSAAPAASGQVGATQDGWATANLDWSKADATDYMIAVRQISGEATLPGLTSGVTPPVGGSRALSADEAGVIGAKGDLSAVAHPLVLVRSDAALSADSQPYATLERMPVHDGQDVTETVNLDGAARRNVRLVVARQSSATTEPLTVSLGGTQGTVEVADVEDAVRRLREVTVVLDATVSPTGDTVITVSCPAPDGQGWEVVRLDVEGQHATAAWGDGQDVPVLVTGAPDAVAGVGAA